ncbi:hypothetical protein M501DRAFT_926043 [Patellaria atrata CBS 101060]|uniref:Uncharacterized protein n=1 Tax=Patellaria atrata CBS 101060 TaxID=1346257 RepID=A0A9P4SJX8_9PEZI|nr:hypothetical protein M501DRAFT_926043 [Patellaria atrata CBS 101060]
MEGLCFLGPFAVGNDSLTIRTPDGSVSKIENLDVRVLGPKCPLLGYTFEFDESFNMRGIIEADSRTAVICFLRFLFMGDYLLEDIHCLCRSQNTEAPAASPDDITIQDQAYYSLLIHAQLFRMGVLFDLPELQVSARANMTRETELACSQPTPPADICETIAYLYKHLSKNRELIDTVINYCVGCFSYHDLGGNPEFRQLAFDLVPFHTDLCRTNFERNFQDEGAMEILQLPAYETENGEGLTQPDALDEVFSTATSLANSPFSTPVHSRVVSLGSPYQWVDTCINAEGSGSEWDLMDDQLSNE